MRRGGEEGMRRGRKEKWRRGEEGRGGDDRSQVKWTRRRPGRS